MSHVIFSLNEYVMLCYVTCSRVPVLSTYAGLTVLLNIHILRSDVCLQHGFLYII